MSPSHRANRGSTAALPIAYPRDAVFTIEQVAAALGVSVSTVRRMDLPTIYIGRQPRYLWGMVLDALEGRAE